MNSPEFFVVLVVVAILIAGALPTWPYSQSWGYAPTSILVLILIALLAWSVFKGNAPRVPEVIKTDLQSTGQDLKSLGRDTASLIRNTVQ